MTLDPRERDPDGAYGRVRLGVFDRLVRAADALPSGIAFLVIEGHRSAREQARRFDSYAERIRLSGIDDPAEVRRQASAFVSPVDVAPHCAGAALDLTLVNADGIELDMGCAVNGPPRELGPGPWEELTDTPTCQAPQCAAGADGEQHVPLRRG